MSKLLRAGRAEAAALARRCVRAALALSALVTTVVLTVAAPALADPVTVTPSGAGMGTLGTKIQNLLNMTGQVALWASLGSVLVGAAVWGLSKHFGNYGGAHKGMQLVIGGGVGGLLVAGAATIVNSAFGA